jgi:hypothetical protein
MEFNPMCNRMTTVDPEEYAALMSSLRAPDVEEESTPISPEIETKIKTIEFCMIILIALVVMVFFLCKGN